MTTYIYTLADPITTEIRYVGKSIDPPTRLRRHLSEAKNSNNKTHKINWLKGLMMLGLKPKLDIIDETEGDWQWLETHWIFQLKAWGFNLVNGTNGGDNPPSWKGRTHSDEYKLLRKKLMAINNPSKNMNDEWRKNISNSHKTNKLIPKKAIESNRVKVKQYTLSGDYIKTWESITDAANFLKMKTSWSIGAVCRGERNKAGGYKWLYYEG